MHPAPGEEPIFDVSARARRIVRATELEADALREEIALRRGAAQDAARRTHGALSGRAAEAQRLEALSADAVRLAETALRQVRELGVAADAVARALRAETPDSPAPAPGTPAGTSAAPSAPPGVPADPPAPPFDPPGAPRFTAIEMAVGGSTRQEVDAHLRERFGLADTSAILDGVFGPNTEPGSRLTWGR